MNEETICLDLIRKVGIRGNFFAEEHRVLNFRKTLWFPHFLDRTDLSFGEIHTDFMIVRANQKRKTILEEAEPYHLEPGKRKELDKIQKEAKKYC